MEPTNRKIQALVDMYLTRELLLPEMQRKYVWRATQVRDLLDSIYRDYPSGSILIWETENLPEVKTPAFQETSQRPMGKKLLLLDGQQRLTSLASILSGCPVRIKEGTKIKEKFVDIYFNLDHPNDSEPSHESPRLEVGDLVEARWQDGEFYPGRVSALDHKRYLITYDDGTQEWTDEVRDLSEETRKELYFQVRNKSIENQPNWISVTALFKEGVGSILRKLRVGADHPHFDRYNQRVNQLYSRKDSYLYPIQIIRDKPYSEVTQIFIRVNSAGTRLRGSDLALAQITSAWPGSMKQFEEFIDRCIEEHFYLDENFLVRCIICIATDQAKFDNMSRIPLETLKKAWDSTKRGVENAITYLKTVAYVDSSATLPSHMLLVPLVYYSCRHQLSASDQVEKGFLRWFYNAGMWGRYSATMETRLTQDLARVKEKRPWIGLLENIWQVVGKDRRVTAEDFRAKTVTSPLFFIMYVLARKRQARDYETGSVINYTNFGTDNEIQYDHIFPKSKLESYFKAKMEKSERKKIINEICNIAFMTRQGNTIKTNEDPESYFPKVFKKFKGEAIFGKQQIPYDLGLVSYDKYLDFLDERASLLSRALNEFLDELTPA